MSHYAGRAINPQTGIAEDVFFWDDYYGKHQYGVEFKGGVVYPEEDVKAVESSSTGSLVANIELAKRNN
tara:strand:+ start:4290 stop:4496 length:207 start_codon:yes stop_codon:yes gene_type:complete